MDGSETGRLLLSAGCAISSRTPYPSFRWADLAYVILQSFALVVQSTKSPGRTKKTYVASPVQPGLISEEFYLKEYYVKRELPRLKLCLIPLVQLQNSVSLTNFP